MALNLSESGVPVGEGAQLPPLESFTLDNTLGAVVVGFAASCALYGILLTQTWTYYKTFSSDSVLYKILVGAAVLLCAADQALIGHFTYYYTLKSVGNPLAMFTDNTTWSIILQQTVSSVIGTIVKCAFASRVYRFSDRNPFITAIIVLLSLGQMAVSMIFTIQAFGLETIPAVFHLRMIGTISLALGVGTDVVIAAALCFYLSRLRTGYKAADSLVTRLVVDTINTGVLTTAVSLSTLLLFNFNGNAGLTFLATFFLLSKFYAISFLATLNTRRAVRGKGTDAETGALEESGLPSAGFPGQVRSGSGGSSRKRQQEETNIFALGTRLPSFYEGGDNARAGNGREYDEYPYPFEGKPADTPYGRGLQPQYAY